MSASGTILDRICADKRALVNEHKHLRPVQELLKRAEEQAAPRGFSNSLTRHVKKDGVGLICEIKKASPSAGLIREHFDPAQLARSYQHGGASCLSVLTEQKYFQGSDTHLGEARSACDLPVLRKDFILDPYQVIEARALGADCVLLILAAMDDSLLAQLEETALGYGMDVILEVHEECEMERALKCKSPLIGINNRNLKLMKTDLGTTERLAPMASEDRILISESGINTPQDIQRMMAAGVHRFLIGESLMKKSDIEAATKQLVAAGKPEE